MVARFNEVVVRLEVIDAASVLAAIDEAAALLELELVVDDDVVVELVDDTVELVDDTVELELGLGLGRM